MHEQRFVVTDHVWQRLEPHLPAKASDAGATAKEVVFSWKQFCRCEGRLY